MSLRFIGACWAGALWLTLAPAQAAGQDSQDAQDSQDSQDGLSDPGSLGGAETGAGQSTASTDDPGEDGPVEFEVDETRLDVERLPPEAIEVTRDLYSHGIFMEGWVGGRGFVGGIGNLSSPGLYANVGVGIELFRFLYIKLAFEGSFHQTDAPPPPSSTVFELLGALVEVKLQIDVSARVGLWLQGELGGVLAFGDVLPTYGVQGADEVGLMYGGSAGFDWHLYNRHYSFGLVGGARAYPSLETADGQMSVGVHGAAYLRYVF